MCFKLLKYKTILNKEIYIYVYFLCLIDQVKFKFVVLFTMQYIGIVL